MADLIRKNKMAAAHIEGRLNIVTGKTTCLLFVYVTLLKIQHSQIHDHLCYFCKVEMTKMQISEMANN